MTTFYIGHQVYSELDFYSSGGEWDGSFFATHGITVRPTKTYVALVVPAEALTALLLEVDNAEDILDDRATEAADFAIHRGMATLQRKIKAELLG